MPISHKHKIIFVHIPKTAGQTIEKSLNIFGEDNSGKLKASMDILYGILNGKSLQHLTIQEIKKIRESEFRIYKKIAFVRNPFDRIISEYFWRMQYFGKKMIKFKNFLVEEVIPRKNGIPKVMKNFYKHENVVKLIDDHYMDQYKFITDNKGNIMVDFIGRFENLNDDFKKACGLELINQKIQCTKHNNYKEYYDSETKLLVEKCYKKDLELFKYEF